MPPPLVNDLDQIDEVRGIHKLRWQSRAGGSPKCQRRYLSPTEQEVLQLESFKITII